MSESLVVTAPSRLHFGMFSFGHPTLRQFGGAGVMIDGSPLTLRIDPSPEFAAVGTAAERIRGVLERVRGTEWGRSLSPCRLEVRAAPRSHVGLGSGTQTALSVVAGLRAWAKLPPLEAVALAELSGRARRSAVGLHGFLHGGLIVEAGRLPHEAVAPLAAAASLPASWRFVLICPRAEEGLSGERERAAFATLPPVSPALTDELSRLALLELLPAARVGDFAGFAEAAYHFGAAAGRCFKSHQAGVYATEPLARLVERIRASGVAGVGQSSWGPTLFTLHPTDDAAQRFLAECASWPDAGDYEFTLASANRGGAKIESV